MDDTKEPEALITMLRIFAAIVAGLALLAVATPIAVMAAAIVLQPAWKDWRAEAKSLLSLVTRKSEPQGSFLNINQKKEKKEHGKNYFC